MLMLEKVFEIMNQSGLDYCVQNKYEMMPEEIPSDIDIMYANASENFFDELIGKISLEMHLIITQKVVHDYLQYTYVLSPKTPEHSFRLQLDFYRALSFRKYKNVMPGEEMLESKRLYKGFYVPAYDVELAYLIMRRTIKYDLDDGHLAIAKRLIALDCEKCTARLNHEFGSELTELLLDMIERQDKEVFYSNHRELSGRLLEISKKKTGVKFHLDTFTFSLVKIFPQRILSPVGYSVAFLAPDGAGKSTLIEGIENTCEGSFYGIKKYYFRPHFLKNMGSYNLVNPHGEDSVNPNPHGVMPDGKFKSIVRFGFYQLDFILGWAMVIEKDLLRKKLVLFDRYYFDYYADMLRYRYSLSSGFAEKMRWMVPKPDLLLILDGDSEVFYARKQELTKVEIENQLKAYRKVASQYKNAVLLKADRTVNEVLAEATETILCKKAMRTLTQMKISKEMKDKLQSNLLMNSTKDMICCWRIHNGE